jgi:ribosomal protein L20
VTVQERAVTQLKRRERVVYMSKRVEEQENQNMKQVKEQEINFTDYAPVDKAYTKQELAEIYKKIIQDIDEGKYN